jgi:TonB-dependent receptor
MSSTNYYDRGIDLSILSDDLIRGVEVSKSLRADMDADAFGGVVNLTLKTAEPGLHYTMSGNGAYNNLRDTYKNYKFAASVSDRFLDDQIGVLLLGNIEQKQLPSDQFNASYDAPTFDNTTQQFFINTNNATVTQSDINRHRYGASLILDYTSDLVDVKFLNVYDQKRDSNKTRTYVSYFESNTFNYNIYVNQTRTEQRTHSLSALFKLGGTELPVSAAYTRGYQTVPNGMEFDFQQSNVLPHVPQPLWNYGNPLDLMKFQGVMDPYNSSSVLWNMFVGNTMLQDDSYDVKAEWKIPFVLSDDFSGKLSAGGKYHEVRRESSNGRVSYNVQYGSNTRRVNLIAAVPFLHGANPNPNPSGGIPAAPYFLDPSYGTTSILGYPIGPGFDIGKLTSMMNIMYPAWLSTFYTDGPSWYNQLYHDREFTRAGYVMGEVNVGSDLTVVPGVRYQEEQTSIQAFHVKLNGSNQNGLSGEAPRLAESYRLTPGWYPSMSVKYKVNENISVLGGVFKSISLPSFGEVTPELIYAIQGNAITTGNPMLVPSDGMELRSWGQLLEQRCGSGLGEPVLQGDQRFDLFHAELYAVFPVPRRRCSGRYLDPVARAEFELFRCGMGTTEYCLESDDKHSNERPLEGVSARNRDLLANPSVLSARCVKRRGARSQRGLHELAAILSFVPAGASRGIWTEKNLQPFLQDSGRTLAGPTPGDVQCHPGMGLYGLQFPVLAALSTADADEHGYPVRTAGCIL